MYTSIFEIPELFIMVVDLLSPHDIAKLMATCKYLYYKLEPMLWRHPTIGKYLPEKESLLRNRKHIQTLDVGSNAVYIYEILGSHLPPMEPVSSLHPSIAARVALPATVNLKKLQIPDYIFFCSRSKRKDTRIISQVIPIIRNSPNLVQLYLSAEVLKSYTNSILDAISNKLPLLRILSLGNHSITLKIALQFLLTCFQHPRLEDLKCDFHLTPTNSYPQTLGRNLDSVLTSLASERKKRGLSSTAPSESRITAIRLPSFSEKQASIVIRILHILREYCPNLERFDIPKVGFDYDAERDFPSKGWFAHLQHLTYSGYAWPNCDFLDSLLEGCSKGVGVRIFHATSLSDRKDGPGNARVLDTLMKFHAGTLEDIDVNNYEFRTSRDILNILKKCEKLTKFWTTAGKRYHDIKHVGTLSGDWVCSNLKELSLVFDTRNTEQGNVQDDKQSALLAATNVFKQVGRLTKLEKLGLGWKGVECLCHCDVGHEDLLSRQQSAVEFETLADLRNLRQFYMFTDCWQHVGQTEVKFMHNHWPCLKEISIQRLGEDMTGRPHWQWLKEQRPRLQLHSIY